MRNSCTVEGCVALASGHGFCGKHYQRWRRHGDVHTLGKMMPAPGTKCAVEGCEAPFRSKGYCALHYRRLLIHGDALAVVGVKDGSGYVNRQGYRVLYRPSNSEANVRGEVLEHRLVMAASLGRSLLDTETVHHRNGDRSDNRPGNLELWSTSQPPGQRIADKVAWAREILALYAPEAEEQHLRLKAVE